MAACAAEPTDVGDDTPPDPQPTPAFRMLGVSGAIAIDDGAIRAEYRRDGLTNTSDVVVTLAEDLGNGSYGDACDVRLPAALVAMTQRSTATHEYNVVRLDLAQPIAGDGCGWDDAYLEAELAALGPVDVGFAEDSNDADDDAQDLDVLYDGPWLEGSPAIVYTGGATGYAMDADGTVSDTAVNWLPGVFERGLYEF